MMIRVSNHRNETHRSFRFHETILRRWARIPRELLITVNLRCADRRPTLFFLLLFISPFFMLRDFSVIFIDTRYRGYLTNRKNNSPAPFLPFFQLQVAVVVKVAVVLRLDDMFLTKLANTKYNRKPPATWRRISMGKKQKICPNVPGSTEYLPIFTINLSHSWIGKTIPFVPFGASGRMVSPFQTSGLVSCSFCWGSDAGNVMWPPKKIGLRFFLRFGCFQK